MRAGRSCGPSGFQILLSFRESWIEPSSKKRTHSLIITSSTSRLYFDYVFPFFSSREAAKSLSSSRQGSVIGPEMSGDNEIKVDQTKEACGKEACDPKTSKCLSDEIIPHILNLYSSSATPRDFEIYAPNASFEDPLTSARGVKEIKSAFYSLSKVFTESRIVDYSVKEELIAPGKHEIIVDSKQYYKFLGRDINLDSLIKLYVVEGKIIRHEDWWNKKPLLNRETVKLPMVGRVLEMTRRGAMLAAHAMMGFGKD